MASDHVDREAEQRQEAPPADARPVPDRPGQEGVTSRAQSREIALAANEIHPPADEGMGETPRSYAERLDEPIDQDEPTPREVLERFSPTDAGLPEVTEQEAAEYVEQNLGERPWLAAAKDCDPSVLRVLVAMDKGLGHALERHEGWADDEKLQRRVTALEDPAQLDDAKRVAGIDGCKPGNKDHQCGTTATAIHDPVAFAITFARGIENLDVRRALRTPFKPGRVPENVNVAIKDILGPEAHRYCSGYQIKPVGGSFDAARDCRTAWVAASRADREPDVPDPTCATIESFDGAKLKYAFRPTAGKDGYEVATMYVEPSEALSMEK